MSSVDPADAALCATCGRPWTEVDGGRTWLHLEVTWGDAAGDPNHLDVDFCSQDHATDWLGQPLPEPVPTEPFRMTWRDRLAATGVGLSFGIVGGLAMLGLWTAGRFVSDFF